MLAAAQTHPVRIGVVVSAQDLHAPGKYIYLCNRRVACCIAYKLSVERKVIVMLVLILGVLSSIMLLIVVIMSGKYWEQVHHSESLQRSVDIYTARSARDWSNIMQLLEKNKNAVELWEFARNDAEGQRRNVEVYKALYREAVKDAAELRDEKNALREQFANKTQECVLIARELESYIAKFEGDM